ncbi:hypothetical protein [Streptomyces sp. Root369]|uniref:hypothetical protein n=1 Tax=Streptomyces sp. Root369 TaxID=1736523 RepID=UPI00070DC317|nr:hypothetical protein [Streptomyces sp. Root369]KQW13553.1 hypothetical protein ASD08_30785 [Streptomyces sp. Root369]
MFMTYQAEAPAVLRMRCVRCALENLDTAAEFLMSAASGHGMATCAQHCEVTARVLTVFTGIDDAELRALFALTALAGNGDPLPVVAEPDRPRAHAVQVIPARLLELQGKARKAAREAGPLDGHKLIAALEVYGIPGWLAGEGGASYVLAAVDGTADEGEAHTGPKVYLYSEESADQVPADHAKPWACALYAADGEFADVLFTTQAGMDLDAECAHAALCLAAWLDVHADRYPRA